MKKILLFALFLTTTINYSIAGGCTQGTPDDLTNVTVTAGSNYTQRSFAYTIGNLTPFVYVRLYTNAARTTLFSSDLNNSVNPSFTVFGLACNTTYWYSVQPYNDCGMGALGTAVLGSFTTAVCSCSDGILNQTETAIDCGGTCPACAAVPDDCASAMPLTWGNGSQAWKCTTNTGATTEASPAIPACWSNDASPQYETIWFSVTVPAGQTGMAISTDYVNNTNYAGGNVAVYSGTCAGTLTLVDCASYNLVGDNTYEETGGVNAEITGLTASTTYLIRVDGVLDYDGQLCIKATSLPTNDSYGSPTTLTAGVTTNGSTYGATAATTGSDCDLSGSNSVIDCGAGGGASIENNVYYLVPCATTGSYTLGLSSVVCNSGPTGGSGLQIWASLNNATCSTWAAQKQDGGASEFCNNTANVSNSMTSGFTCNAGQTVRVTVDGFAGELCTYGITFTAPVPTPIDLLSYEAAYNGEQVSLTWVTAAERENDYFLIEKSLDGSNYFEFQRVKGAGNSSDKLIYNIYDTPTKFEDFAYYRLSQVDYNGKTTVYDSKFVNFSGLDYVVLEPNPTSSNFNVHVNTSKAENATVEVKDNNGKLIYASSFESSKGENIIPINLDDENAGVYFVKTIVSGKVVHSKIVKTTN